jgi:hypothetical protein
MIAGAVAGAVKPSRIGREFFWWLVGAFGLLYRPVG